MVCLWAATWLVLLNAGAIALFLSHKRDRSTHIRVRALLALICLVSLAGLLLTPARAVIVYEYGLTGTPVPWGIAIDKDGAVWITEQGANRIAKVSVPFYQMDIPTVGAIPWGITASKDHEDIWVTEETHGKIARYAPSEQKFYEWGLPDQFQARPRGITMNITKMSNGKTPRYDVWFTEWGRNRIGHLYGNETHGATNVRFSFYSVPYPTPGVNTQPLCIAMSPMDYSIWFTEYGTNRISSIKLLENGTALFRHYATTPDSGLWGIGVDPNGFVWVTESKRNCIGRLNPVSGEYVTFAVPTPNSEPRELAIEATTIPPFTVLNVWFTEYSSDRVSRYDPGLNVFFEYPIISVGGRPHGVAVSGPYGTVWFTEPFAQKVGSIYGWSAPPLVTTTTVGTISSAVMTSRTMTTSRAYTNSSAASIVAAINTIGSAAASATLVTSTYTFTSSMLQLTTTSIYSYTMTSWSTSYTTTTTTTTATQTIVSVSTLPTTTSTTATFTSWMVQPTTSTTSRTNTIVIVSTSSTTTTVTATSTLNYPTVTVILGNTSFIATTTFSPTVTLISVRTSVTPTTSVSTSILATTTVTTTTVGVTRPCVIASVAYGSQLAPEVQFLRMFRDRAVLSTLAGAQFMRVFNAFYYSFSPKVAELTGASPALQAITRVFMYPLVASLRSAEWMFNSLQLNPELMVLLAGTLASSLIGTIYISPIVLLLKALRKKPRRR